jgi:hypothetical protein
LSNIVTNTKDKNNQRLLELMGMPFEKVKNYGQKIKRSKRNQKLKYKSVIRTDVVFVEEAEVI